MQFMLRIYLPDLPNCIFSELKTLVELRLGWEQVLVRLEPALEDPVPDRGLEEQALELELAPEGQILEPELVGQVPALVCQSTAPAAEAQLDKVVSLCFKTLRMNIMMNSSLHKYLQLLDREDGLHPQEERRLLDQMVSLHCCHTWDKKTLSS